MSHGHFESAGHEPDRASVPAVIAGGVVIVVLVLGAVVAEAGHLIYFQSRMPDRVAAHSADVSNPPERVVAWAKPGLDLAALREQENARLKGYGWVDQKAGVVRIPVARAMELLTAPPVTENAGAEPVRSK